MAFRHEDMTELRCVSYTSKGTSEMIVAGLQTSMFTVDVEKGMITRKVEL